MARKLRFSPRLRVADGCFRHLEADVKAYLAIAEPIYDPGMRTSVMLPAKGKAPKTCLFRTRSAIAGARPI